MSTAQRQAAGWEALATLIDDGYTVEVSNYTNQDGAVVTVFKITARYGERLDGLGSIIYQPTELPEGPLGLLDQVQHPEIYSSPS